MRTSRADLLPCSVLLAVEAMRRAPSLEADQTLRRGLALLPRPIARLGHEESVQKIALSPDGRYVTTASTDHTARVWETSNGLEMVRLTHESPVWTAAFSVNGRYLATLSADHTTHMWLWQPEDLIAEACARLTRDLTPEEWRQYVGNEPFRKTRATMPGRSPQLGHKEITGVTR